MPYEGKLDTVVTNDQAAHGSKQGPKPLVVFRLAGTEREMGLQHAALLRQVGGWRPTLEYYPRMVERVIAGAHDGPDLLGAALTPVARVALKRLHRRRPPELRERSEAFYRGLGLAPEEASSLGVMDVLQNFIGVAGAVGVGGVRRRLLYAAPAACSTLSVWGEASADGRLLHARNFDFPGTGVWEQGQAVVFCRPDDGIPYGFVTTRGADVPAVSAFNEAGLCLTTHTRFHQHVDFGGALIVDMCHEVIRRAETVEQAVSMLRGYRSASTWGVMVSSGRERRSALVELTARGSAVTEPTGPWLTCTNRYRASALQRSELQPSPGFMMHSDGRFQVLERHAQAFAEGDGATPEALQALLGSHEDGDLPDVERAAGGVLAQANGVHAVVLDPERQQVDVAVGDAPAGHGPWQRVPWRFTQDVGVETCSAPVAGAEVKPSRYGDGASGVAYRRFLDAARQEMWGGSATVAAEALEEACALDRSEPTYRLLAGGYRLRAGDLSGALSHFEAGLAHERSPFYRARLLLWASRCAPSGTAHRAELAALRHPQIGHYQRWAAEEASTPLPARRLRKTQVQLQLCDLNL